MENQKNNLVIERLTALWALNECGLGGFMHAFSSPFTGILVGGISILLISLIALHSKKLSSTLLKALSIVLLIKLSVSPHSPITAYVAVSFQTICGILLFSIFSVKNIAVVMLGAITFLESSLQKLLTLTILYGQSLWDALDIYGAWVSDKLAFLQLTLSSKSIIFLYITFYFLSGIIVGFLIVRIMTLVKAINTSNINVTSTLNTSITTNNRFFLPKRIFIFWGITLAIIAIPLLFMETKSGGLQKGVYLVARSFLILIIWYIFIGPSLLKVLNKLLANNKNRYKKDIQNTLDLFPHLRYIISEAWEESKLKKGRKRVSHFLAISIAYSIHFKLPEK